MTANTTLDKSTLDGIRTGGKAGLARALAAIERNPDSPQTLALLSQACRAPQAHVIGITGPPGVGKSTLIGKVIDQLRAQEKTVGVIAVDPSSRLSGGALLGDRIRLPSAPHDGVYIRSMAARDRLGGLARLTAPTTVLMRALFDAVLIETVGVGQSEIDIANICDSVVLCLQPGSGDSLQFMKAGIVEIPDIIAVTKSDMGAPARAALADIKAAVKIVTGNSGDRETQWVPPILALSSLSGEGVDPLLTACQNHWNWLTQGGHLDTRRARQDHLWLVEFVREEFGRQGLDRLATLTLKPQDTPFEAFAAVRARLSPAPD